MLKSNFYWSPTDYFTIEVEPLTQIKGKNVRNFLWKYIICRFGIPREITTDNGTQFESWEVSDLCKELQIEHHFSTPTYPQGNGQAKIVIKPS